MTKPPGPKLRLQVARQAIRDLRGYTNPARLAATLSYFPSAMENLGVAVPQIRKVARAVRKQTKEWSDSEVHDLAFAIIAENTLEGRQLAYELFGLRTSLRDGLSIPKLKRLGKGMDNWTSVDVFSTTIAGQAWRAGSLTDAEVMRWTNSRDRWWRRAALASTIPLNMASRGGTGDAQRTLKICQALAGDKDEMVAKGLSWALRSLIPIDESRVEDFLSEHEALMAARVKREVRNKLETGRKNR
ncbi:MAG: 3-methyladenine DNA glycosylase AlkD [Candidatus Paceibacteria bacterium]|jgi:3-methyladenine DNA glycosylase AlkD